MDKFQRLVANNSTHKVYYICGDQSPSNNFYWNLSNGECKSATWLSDTMSRIRSFIVNTGKPSFMMSEDNQNCKLMLSVDKTSYTKIHRLGYVLANPPITLDFADKNPAFFEDYRIGRFLNGHTDRPPVVYIIDGSQAVKEFAMKVLLTTYFRDFIINNLREVNCAIEEFSESMNNLVILVSSLDSPAYYYKTDCAVLDNLSSAEIECKLRLNLLLKKQFNGKPVPQQSLVDKAIAEIIGGFNAFGENKNFIQYRSKVPNIMAEENYTGTLVAGRDRSKYRIHPYLPVGTTIVADYVGCGDDLANLDTKARVRNGFKLRVFSHSRNFTEDIAKTTGFQQCDGSLMEYEVMHDSNVNQFQHRPYMTGVETVGKQGYLCLKQIGMPNHYWFKPNYKDVNYAQPKFMSDEVREMLWEEVGFKFTLPLERLDSALAFPYDKRNKWALLDTSALYNGDITLDELMFG